MPEPRPTPDAQQRICHYCNSDDWSPRQLSNQCPDTFPDGIWLHKKGTLTMPCNLQPAATFHDAQTKEGEPRDAIAQALFLFEYDDCSAEQWKQCLASLETSPFWAGGKHHGDCTNEPFTCNRCFVEEIYKGADAIIAVLAAQPHQPHQTVHQPAEAQHDYRKVPAWDKDRETDNVPDQHPDDIQSCGHRLANYVGDEGGTFYCEVCAAYQRGAQAMAEKALNKLQTLLKVATALGSEQKIQAIECCILDVRSLVGAVQQGTPVWDDRSAGNYLGLPREQAAPPQDTRYDNLKFIAKSYERQLNEIQEILIEAGLEPEAEAITTVEGVRRLASQPVREDKGPIYHAWCPNDFSHKLEWRNEGPDHLRSYCSVCNIQSALRITGAVPPQDQPLQPVQALRELVAKVVAFYPVGPNTQYDEINAALESLLPRESGGGK